MVATKGFTTITTSSRQNFDCLKSISNPNNASSLFPGDVERHLHDKEVGH
jgi:hypothetical protein